MKMSVFIFVALLLASTLNAGIKPFVNKNGTYLPFDENSDVIDGFVPPVDSEKGSVNYYCSCLGYGKGEVISHFNNDYSVIVLNAFNNEVILFFPNDKTKTTLTQKEVERCFGEYKPNVSDFVSTLKNGVENRSIRQNFVDIFYPTTCVRLRYGFHMS